MAGFAMAPPLRTRIRVPEALARPVRRAVDLFPLTGLGLVVAATSGAALWFYGLRRLDLVLLVVGGAFVVLTVLGLFAVVATSLGLWAHLRRRTAATEPVEVECGFPHRTGFSLGGVRWIPLVDVTWSWVAPPAELRIIAERGRLVEEVTGRRRGIVSGVARRFEVRDVLGLCAIAWVWRDRQPLRFLPTVGALRNLEVVRGMSAGEDLPHPEAPAEGGPFDMRAYAAGDPIRFVLWKVFAKTRDLVVRTPERALAPARQTAAYLVTGHADEAAAGAARLAVAAGALGSGWTLGADGCPEPAKTAGRAVELLTRSAATPEARGGADLAEFIAHHAGRQSARLVVFVPGRPGPWMGPVAKVVREAGERLELVICVDGIVRDEPRRWSKALRRPERPDPAQATLATTGELHAVLHALRGAKISIVDRRAGQIFGAEHLRAMEAA
jgi:uncharacterized protein (DUF58 family)